jgi:hypothetical protein
MIWIFLLAGAAACPFAFQAWWSKRWFRIVWWFGLFVIIGGWLKSGGVLN